MNILGVLTKFGGILDDAFDGITLPPNEPDAVLLSVLNAAYVTAGIVAVGFIIYGGVTYITSTGDPSKVKKASMAILYSVIGLIVVILAAAITNFALGAIGG